MDAPESLTDDEDQGLSLEELSQAYASLISKNGSSDAQSGAANLAVLEQAAEAESLDFEVVQNEGAHSGAHQVTPQAVLEAVLFVGRPDNSPISAEELAGLMRGVRTEEIEGYIAELNAKYAQQNRAIRIATIGNAFRLQLADDLQFIRDRFYGPVREIRLNQAAVDCLALIAYQPGVSREDLEDQRGQPSGAVLSQLVRRQLIEVKRQGQPKKTLHYYPTEKLLQLIGLGSLEDLPQVEEWQM